MDEIVDLMSGQYTNNLMKQLFKIIGSVDILVDEDISLEFSEAL